ncbi:uncharacterized protein LAESUDRAFT_715813 [Laetiporus sulphureus 93-53]|uniref:Uncharacterized protein n=1 Tax=Laetiporus sulphureus 93-53 TaxID=1314785 RepID=A0A165D3U7_9APHY|nr:uncharacterized protein LAESUDRAFT_715813 [Laetiporus sulphureus 93-53]KZT04103.1 hypothetical protein LAESUDRAFT_715813 [Laetiporus sulphureus 93-53]
MICQFERVGDGDAKREHQKQAGYRTCIMLCHVINLLHELLAACTTAITVAAHVQCLALEIAGYAIYVGQVGPHLESTQQWRIIPLIPVWFMQPWTEELVVHKVVEPDRLESWHMMKVAQWLKTKHSMRAIEKAAKAMAHTVNRGKSTDFYNNII